MMSRSEKAKQLEEQFEKEEKKEKTKKIGKTIAKIIFILITIFLLFILYMHFVGTKGLIVREYKVESERLPESFHGFKIVHFSDLHYLTTIHKEELDTIVNKINELNPDIVVFTGDLIDSSHEITEEEKLEVSNSLKEIKATVGLFAVKGNHDYESNTFESIFRETSFQILDNSYQLIYYNDTTPIVITGIGSILKNDCDIDKAFEYEDISSLYTISLLHEPDNLDTILSKYQVDLALAGHSHNGQIRLPGIGAILSVEEGKKYPNEHYVLGDTSLYVSGGLGTSMYEFRLFNHPSINFYRLVTK